MAEKYLLKCLTCGQSLKDDYNLSCGSHQETPSFLRTEYSEKKFTPTGQNGLFKYSNWLPVENSIKTDSGPITYKSSGLAKTLGLKNLYIGFSGYWPEKKARTLTCSFKESEAFPTLLRARERGIRSLTLASTGSTGRAFAYAASIMDFPVTIVVPKSGLHRIWTTEKPSKNVRLICLGNGDYYDAIELAKKIGKEEGINNEGGAKNVARRDGMGTVMLDGAVKIGKIPDHYFQAIGSGTGAIAAWEACLRLIEDGNWGDRLPRLQLSQNLPFAPMHHAWKDNRREIIEEKDMPEARKLIKQMYTDILSNRLPSYSITGGIYDAMKDCSGNIFGITNDEAKEAKTLFESSEGIDILPAAAVAVASLVKAARSKEIKEEEIILLNITGGGEKRLREDYKVRELEPSKSV